MLGKIEKRKGVRCPVAQMSQEAMARFLAEKRLARFATVNPDGSPQVTPVWYEYDGQEFRFTTTRSRVKGRNLAKNPRVAFSIDDERPPYRGVIVHGTAVMTEHDASEVTRRLALRYLGEKDGPPYAERLLQAPDRVAVHVRPEKILTWDYSG